MTLTLYMFPDVYFVITYLLRITLIVEFSLGLLPSVSFLLCLLYSSHSYKLFPFIESNIRSPRGGLVPHQNPTQLPLRSTSFVVLVYILF